ncbi:MAG: peptidylprolyl isomerase [Bdellovibrionales bacterium]
MKNSVILSVILGLWVSVAQARVVDKIVAIVNDQIITASDVDKFKKKLSQNGLVDDALLKLTDADSLLKDKKALLEHLIDEKLIDSEVKRKSMEVTIERVEQEIRNIAKNNNISRAQLKDALAAKGVSMSQYQDFIKTSLERQSIVEKEVTNKIRISDEDISSYYLSKSGDNSQQTFEYTLAHIVFSPKTGGEKGAMERANSVLDKLKTGQAFEKLAEQFSEDPAFSKGGLLGTFKTGEMLNEIDAAVKTVEVGEITPVVKTSNGLHIIKVVKKTLISDPKLEEKKEDIRRVLYAEAFKRQFRLWLKQRRDDSFIKINGV